MYLQCCKSSHPPIYLPDESPVVIGRSKETKIADKLCSRTQLEVTAKYDQKYAMVKQLGRNPSQIDSIDIGYRKTDKLIFDQVLHIVDMKYPHKLMSSDSGRTEDDIPVKRLKLLPASNKTASLKTDMSTHENFAEQTDKSSTAAFSKLRKDRSSMKPVHWSQGLKSSVADQSLHVYKDDLVVVIKDKYPKAEYHWLVMPIENITTTSQLHANHVNLLRHMLKVGKDVARHTEKDVSKDFRFGYHAVQSMTHLHMHVISQDFCSPSLKTKKHWNSFTTAYFVDATEIIDELEQDGKVTSRKHLSELLNQSLRCNKCGASQKNMPQLKGHLQHCVCAE